MSEKVPVICAYADKPAPGPALAVVCSSCGCKLWLSKVGAVELCSAKVHFFCVCWKCSAKCTNAKDTHYVPGIGHPLRGLSSEKFQTAILRKMEEEARKK